MTGRIYTTQFTVPAGTSKASPFSQSVILDDEQLDLVDIDIPSGHVGKTGLAILWSGVQIFPYTAGTWLVGDDDDLQWPYGGEITANGLSLSGYNTDIFPHSFYLRWHVSLRTGQSPITIVSPQASGLPVPDLVAAVAGLSG